MVIVRALYGLKTSGAAWRNHLSEGLNELGFKSSLADHDVWFKTDINDQGQKYYSYILVYVDDLLTISERPKNYLDWINMMFRLKPSSVKSPYQYLGNTIMRRSPQDSTNEYFAMGSRVYVKE